MEMKGIQGKLLIGVVSLLLVCALLGGIVQVVTNPIALGQAGISFIVSAATDLASHIFGSRSNTYNSNDPGMQKAIQYWQATCGSKGQLCPEATSGNLQCVMFVAAVFAQANSPLPAIGNAIDFWSLYQKRSGWTEVPVQTGMPAPGDIVVWQGGPYGHVAVVVKVAAPSNGQNGSLTVAQANAPGNLYPGSAQAGNLYTMPILPNLAVQTWSGYQVLGYIRRTSTNGTPVISSTAIAGISASAANSPYLQTALNAAKTANIPQDLFIKQINAESGFNPRAVSPAGAVGIAQFMPSTAAAHGIDPLDPVQALVGAANLMASYYQQYLGTDNSPANQTLAYEKALAAYNAGTGSVSGAVGGCKAAWLTCLPAETQNYIHKIMGVVIV